MLLQSVPQFASDYEQVENVLSPGHFQGKRNRAAEFFGIGSGKLAPLFVPPVEFPQLDAQHCRLNLVQPAVNAERNVFVTRLLPVVPQQPQLFRFLLVVHGDRSSVSVRPKVFRGVEAEAAEIAKRTGLSGFVERAVSLASVLDYGNGRSE